jgi:outer membrane protein X
MKKYLTIFIMMLVSTATFAEEGDKWVGVNLNYGFSSEYKNFGIGGKFQYEIKENLRLEAAANYFFSRSVGDGYGELRTWMLDANVNAQYLIHFSDKLRVYPIIGPTFMLAKASDKDGGVTDHFTGSRVRLGVNIGAGIEYQLNDQIKLNADFKYQYLKDFDRPVIAIGACYKL